MRMIRARYLAFVLRTDVPTWQLYARRVFVPLALGAALGTCLAVGLGALPYPWPWIGVIVLALGGFAWALRELRWARRQEKRIREIIAKLRDRSPMHIDGLYDQQGNPVDAWDWGEVHRQAFADGSWRIGRELLGELEISTVWTGIEPFPEREGGPLTYESIVFVSGHVVWGPVRYATREEAQEAHEKLRSAFGQLEPDQLAQITAALNDDA